MYDVVEAVAGLPLIELTIGSGLKVSPYIFKISSVSPFSDLLISQYDNKNLKNNHFSIALLMEFEDINLFLTSDIEKRTINRFYDNIRLPNNIHYIKIPHHGSDKSELLLKFMDETDVNKNYQIGCTTVYQNSELPKDSVIKEYKSRCKKVFCTNSKVKTKANGTYGHGTLGVKIDVINKKIGYKCFHDAIEL